MFGIFCRLGGEKMQVKPEFGNNYETGLVGFAYHDDNLVSEGITIFTADERKSGIKVSHAFLVEDEEYCLEAVGQGVVRNRLSNYFGDPHCQVHFRRPLDLRGKTISLVMDAARAKLGDAYSIAGILGMLLDKVSRWIFHFTLPNSWRNPLNSHSTWFCSELVSFALCTLPFYRDQPLFKEYHPSRISPQLLYENGPFEPFSCKGENACLARWGNLKISDG
jgi:hypothetical protein